MGCRRENTGRGLTRLRAAPPVSEGWHKTEDPEVRQVLHRDNRCLLGQPGFSIKNLGRCDTKPSRAAHLMVGYHPWGPYCLELIDFFWLLIFGFR